MKTPPPAAAGPGCAAPEIAGEDPPGVLSIDLFGRRHRLASADQAFWRKAAAGDWERGTLRFFRRALGASAEAVCVDVGAWIGPTALFAAQFCRRVFAVEPDPAAYARLLANLRLNAAANIMPCRAAIAAFDGRAQLANRRHFGNSMTRAQPPTAAAGDISGDRATAPAMRLPAFIERFGIDRIDLLKIDIEGGEFDLLPQLLALPAKYRPAIHLSLHAPFFPAAERAGKLAAVAELAAQYTHIYDQHNAAITARDLASGAEFRDKFQVAAMSNCALF